MLMLLRKVYSLLYIRFSSTFSIFDNRKNDQLLLLSNFECVLKIGITFPASFEYRKKNTSHERELE